MDVIRICSHYRTGTHALARLLWSNFAQAGLGYEDLHCSHSKAPEGRFVHLHRPVLPVMMSMWRMRDRFGIDLSVTFDRMIRTPWPEMPRTRECEAALNGENVYTVGLPAPFEATMPQRWFDVSTDFDKLAAVSVAYSWIADRPMVVLNLVEAAFPEFSRGDFCLPSGRVGWWSLRSEEPHVSGADARLLEDYQDAFERR